MKLSLKLLAGMAAVALTATSAQAADLIIDEPDQIFSSSLFNFEGIYIGGTGGFGAFPSTGWVGTIGVVAGANFQLGDAFLAGAEFQGDTLWDGSFAGFSALFMGKLGAYLSDDAIIYGTGGAGWIDGTTSYAFGAGLEMALAQQVSGRVEAVATGPWGAMPDGGKVTLGLIWHMN
jgi:opacity protein-like surface antigen